MLFPTIDFAIFFIAIFVASWALRTYQSQRKQLLLAASYFFYGYWDWTFCFLLGTNALISYWGGSQLGKADPSDTQRRKLILGLVVGANLAILAYFKYAGFFVESLGELLTLAGWERDMPILEIILPVGISFFTFQSISYIVDVYRKEIPACKSFVDLALYISFFPQLVAGPIVRAVDFIPQLAKQPALTSEMTSKGLFLITMGLFKKMVLANYLATLYVDDIFLAPEQASSLELLLAVYAYAGQIYCDFSGYSDIAIGVAALLGYHFKRNFNQPYRAASLQEFWRRWHISLSEWLRDYLYKPLGGSHHGTANTYRNLFLTMLLGGIWHGAAMTFVIWGIIHGAALIIERLTGLSKPTKQGLPRILGIFITFHIVCLAWIFFRAESLSLALDYLVAMGQMTTDITILTPFILGLIVFTLAGQFTPAESYEKIATSLNKVSTAKAAASFALGMLIIQWVAPEGTPPFIYFQF